MKLTRGFLIFSYGLFTIAAQTLLFREFITTFEGNDISVGIFFACWFLWVGLGAILVYKVTAFAEKLLANIELLFLSYLPAFILQLILIIHARELAGVESYALLPIPAIVLLSIIINAPVSIITGMLFPTACRWVQSDRTLAVSHVYILEAAGSFLGGLGTTILLASGVSSAKIFFILAFIVSSSAFFASLQRRTEPKALHFQTSKRWGWAFVPVCVLLLLIAGTDKALMQHLRIIKWTKLLPEDALLGSFQTAQAEYLYGIYQGQWLAVREGSVCEALPDQASAGQLAAIGLSQNPNAENALVIGSGLGLCREFLRLPQIKDVTWAHCDTEYVKKLDSFIPPELKITDNRFHRLPGDVRSLLADKKQYYDIVILNLPDATSSVLNRYFTLEFYHQVKQSLRPNGLLQLRIAGGENIMGTELINLGASTKLTLEKVFSHLVLTPGEDTWFIASDSEKLTGQPAILRDQFAKIDGADNIYPPNGLLSIYLPDRAEAAMDSYSTADLPAKFLINRDARPLTHLYSLLLAAKQSQAPAAKFVKGLILAGPLAFLIPILVFVALRLIYILKTARHKTDSDVSPSSFDSTFLVFSAGWVAIATVIVLMYLYQTRFGSLYLHIGVISSLFMVGLTTGAILTRHLLISRNQAQKETLLSAVIFAHILLLVAIAFWPAQQWTHLIFAIAFILCGLCGGSYFPLAASQLADAGFETGQAGSKLETADHLGASAGGLLTSLALVPVLGTKVAIFILILLILANTPHAAMRLFTPKKLYTLPAAAFRLRRLGYILFGIAASIILCSNLLAHARTALTPSLPAHTAQALAANMQLEQASITVDDGARRVNYFKVYKLPKTELAGYIFSSEDLAPEVRGFGGKLNLVIYTDTAGKLIDFHIIRSNETPAYLELLTPWRPLLPGHQLFASQPFADVDTVTGATISSKAVLSALEISGQRFATQILESALIKEKTLPVNYLPDAQGMYLITGLILALIVIYRGGFWSRLAVLIFTLIVGGIILNAQYSSEQIVTILSLHTPSTGLSGVFLLAVGVLTLIILFGNIYCGYLCPFGALQEILSYIIPDRLKPQLSADKMQKARFVKYAVLFVLMLVFFLSRNRTTLAAEPLIKFFDLRFSIHNSQAPLLLLVAIALLGSLFYRRFWCRYLCPVGAFLSLLNNVIILKRYIPPKKFAKCEFGLTFKDQMDCIYCDRCRYQIKAVPKKEPLPQPHYASIKPMSQYFVPGVLVIAIFISALSIKKFSQVTPAALPQPTVSAPAVGQPQDVNLQRIRKMIEQKQLSDREADFYKKVDE